MKRYIISLLLFTGVVFASNEATILKDNFLQSIPQDRQKEFDKYFSTPLFQEALTYFTDQSKMYEASKALADPHSKDFDKAQNIKLPNWVEIYKIYYKSATQENNPVSAFYALFIMRSYLGATRNGDMLAQRSKLAENLYKAKICQGYLEWGDVHNEGISTQVNTEKAHKIYTDGVEVCSKLNNAWQSTVIQMKADQTAKVK